MKTRLSDALEMFTEMFHWNFWVMFYWSRLARPSTITRHFFNQCQKFYNGLAKPSLDTPTLFYYATNGAWSPVSVALSDLSLVIRRKHKVDFFKLSSAHDIEEAGKELTKFWKYALPSDCRTRQRYLSAIVTWMHQIQDESELRKEQVALTLADVDEDLDRVLANLAQVRKEKRFAQSLGPAIAPPNIQGPRLFYHTLLAAIVGDDSGNQFRTTFINRYPGL